MMRNGQLFAQDFAVVKTLLFSSHGDFLTYAMNHQRQTFKSTYDETEMGSCIDKLAVFHANQTAMYLGPHLN